MGERRRHAHRCSFPIAIAGPINQFRVLDSTCFYLPPNTEYLNIRIREEDDAKRLGLRALLVVKIVSASFFISATETKPRKKNPKPENNIQSAAGKSSSIQTAGASWSDGKPKGEFCHSELTF